MRKATIIEAVTQLRASPNPLADESFTDALSAEALQSDLSPEEAAHDKDFDLSEVLRELEMASQASDSLGSDETLIEEDTHEDLPPEQ